MTLRVALYTRVSTEDQARDGFSLDSQIRRLRSLADAQGWKIAGEYVDDGYSGRKVKRPAYQSMMQEKDHWDTIVVAKMDRIHRNSRNFMAMMDQLRHDGKEFASLAESLDTRTAMGRFVMDIIARMAQLEAEVIGERVSEGMEEKYRQTNQWHGPPGYGHSLGPTGSLVVCENEAEVVRWMANLYLQGTSSRAIAAALNLRKLQTRRSGPWTSWMVRHILGDPRIAGYRVWENFPVKQHDAILPFATFEKLHWKLEERGHHVRPDATTTRRARLFAKLQENQARDGVPA